MIYWFTTRRWVVTSSDVFDIEPNIYAKKDETTIRGMPTLPLNLNLVWKSKRP